MALTLSDRLNPTTTTVVVVVRGHMTASRKLQEPQNTQCASEKKQHGSEYADLHTRGRVLIILDRRAAKGETNQKIGHQHEELADCEYYARAYIQMTREKTKENRGKREREREKRECIPSSASICRKRRTLSTEGWYCMGDTRTLRKCLQSFASSTKKARGSRVRVDDGEHSKRVEQNVTQVGAVTRLRGVTVPVRSIYAAMMHFVLLRTTLQQARRNGKGLCSPRGGCGQKRGTIGMRAKGRAGRCCSGTVRQRRRKCIEVGGGAC